MTPSEKIGQLVRARRKFLQLRQRDLAELAGVTLRGLTAIESGRGNPTLKQLSKIASVLGLEVTLTLKPPHAESERLLP
jgi:y4mF family transcriptional regulator